MLNHFPIVLAIYSSYMYSIWDSLGQLILAIIFVLLTANSQIKSNSRLWYLDDELRHNCGWIM